MFSLVVDLVVITLDVVFKLYLGCSGGFRFKVVVSGISLVSVWYVPPGFLVAVFASGDAIYLLIVPWLRFLAVNAVEVNSLMY